MRESNEQGRQKKDEKEVNQNIISTIQRFLFDCIYLFLNLSQLNVATSFCTDIRARHGSKEKLDSYPQRSHNLAKGPNLQTQSYPIISCILEWKKKSRGRRECIPLGRGLREERLCWGCDIWVRGWGPAKRKRIPSRCINVKIRTLYQQLQTQTKEYRMTWPEYTPQKMG